MRHCWFCHLCAILNSLFICKIACFCLCCILMYICIWDFSTIYTVHVTLQWRTSQKISKKTLSIHSLRKKCYKCQQKQPVHSSSSHGWPSSSCSVSFCGIRDQGWETEAALGRLTQPRVAPSFEWEALIQARAMNGRNDDAKKKLKVRRRNCNNRRKRFEERQVSSLSFFLSYVPFSSWLIKVVHPFSYEQGGNFSHPSKFPQKPCMCTRPYILLRHVFFGSYFRCMWSFSSPVKRTVPATLFSTEWME